MPTIEFLRDHAHCVVQPPSRARNVLAARALQDMVVAIFLTTPCECVLLCPSVPRDADGHLRPVLREHQLERVQVHESIQAKTALRS